MDTRLRDLLEELANDMPAHLVAPERLPGRVDRRIARNAVVAIAAVLLLGVGVITGARALLAGPPAVPADTATPDDPFVAPEALVFDAEGNLYVSDCLGNRVFRVEPAGAPTVIAGRGGDDGTGGDGGPATAAELACPAGLAFDPAGNLYIADAFSSRVRKVDTDGVITTYLGTGAPGPRGRVDLNHPVGLASDAQGNLFIADRDNHRVLRVDANGDVSIVAGNGKPGYSGDGGPATRAKLGAPQSVVVDEEGNIFIADGATDVRGTGFAQSAGNDNVRMVDVEGIISTIAGTGATSPVGDGGLATAAGLDVPYGLALDAEANLYVGEALGHRVRRIDPSGIITTVVGTGVNGSGPDGVLATLAPIRQPFGIVVDVAGNLFIADGPSGCIRTVNTGGVIRTVAGTCT